MNRERLLYHLHHLRGEIAAAGAVFVCVGSIIQFQFDYPSDYNYQMIAGTILMLSTITILIALAIHLAFVFLSPKRRGTGDPLRDPVRSSAVPYGASAEYT